MSRQAIRSLSVSARNFYRVAIVGTGPAGFYTAHHLLHKSKDTPISIDFFDRLPAPFGLSRYGVAPDHPEVKNCEEFMRNIMENKHFDTRFFGNVNIGKDISLSDLQDRYHSIVLAYGSTSSDNKLNIPGADHPSVIPARKLVNWYNGHPDAEHWSPPLEGVEDVTIIGNGNVAIDIARILLADPETHWNPTDITSRAVSVLKKSSVNRVKIVARRGVLESAFTNREIRELINVAKTCGIHFVPIPESRLEPIRKIAKSLGRVDKRKFAILEKASAENQTATSCLKELELCFQLSPVEFIVDPENSKLLSKTVFEENELVEDSLTKKVTVKPTGRTVSIDSQLVVLSIGYQGSKLEGFDELDINYDSKRHCLSNNGGRLLKSAPDSEYSYCHGWYTSGWIKHGPQGVIATTMMESFDTAEKVLEDLENGIYNHPKTESDILGLLPSDTVSWNQWEKIDKHEITEGSKVGKTREKEATKAGLLKVAQS